MFKFLSRLADTNEREVKGLQPIVDRINALEPEIQALSDAELAAHTEKLRARLREDVRASLEASVPNPARLGHTSEFGLLAAQILENGYLNGETIRLDGAIRMAPR